jgi:hypothetical protein
MKVTRLCKTDDTIDRAKIKQALKSNKVSKEEFTKNVQTLFGESLVKYIKTTYETLEEHETEVTLTGTGVFLDLEDLTEKYKNKPQRLAAIIKNCNRFSCPTSEVLLYEDMIYQSTRRDTDLYKVSSKRQCVQDKKIAAIKQPKQEATGGDLALHDHPEPKPLTDKQVDAINKTIATLVEDVKKLDGVWEELTSDKFKEYVPQVMASKIAMTKAKLEFTNTLVELAVKEKRGDPKAVNEELRSTKAAVKEIYLKCVSVQKAATDDM